MLVCRINGSDGVVPLDLTSVSVEGPRRGGTTMVVRRDGDEAFEGLGPFPRKGCCWSDGGPKPPTDPVKSNSLPTV